MKTSLLLAAVLFGSIPAAAGNANFAGNWTSDTRPAEMRSRDDICGNVSLVLTQDGEDIHGAYYNAPVGCGRIEDGGQVHGVAIGNSAVLTITSARNGAVAIGVARISSGRLTWTLKEYATDGEPSGDDLILGTFALELAVNK